MARLKIPPLRRVIFGRACRVISSRYPPVGIFDTVVSPEGLAAVYWVESLTNERLRAELGELDLVPRSEWIVGSGSSPVMAAFTHPNPSGSRFSDGLYGVYYAARDEATALAEARYQRERFLRLSADPPRRIEMRMYRNRIAGQFHDLRGLRSQYRREYAARSYVASQTLATRLRAEGSNGIAYESVRWNGGECVAAFRTGSVGKVTQTKHFIFVWNGTQIDSVLQIKRLM